MSVGAWVFLTITLIVAAAICEAFWKRNRKSPLSKKFAHKSDMPGSKPELGMEEINLDGVERAIQRNKFKEEMNDRR